jgi:hypothetical protein
MNIRSFALLAVLLCASPSQAAEHPLVGTWTFDAARSVLVEKDLRFVPVAPNRLRCEGGLGGSYEFAFDDGGNKLRNGRTVAWQTTGANRWRVTKAQDGALIDTTDVVLDGQSLMTVTVGKLPDGSPYQRKVTYRRDGDGRGLVGLWRSIRVNTGATWDGFVISEAADGVVTWRVPTDLQTITGKFDGSDLDVVGPNGPTGTTLAVHPTGTRRYSYVMKSGGKIVERGMIKLSEDGRRMTELTWDEGQPKRMSKGVYIRTP